MKSTIRIEYCPKCGWLLRASYMAQELLTTFAEDIYGVTLVPSAVSGRYTIHVDDTLIWDRVEQKSFPEIKELKQLVRDSACPTKSLGHSDKKSTE